MLSSCRHGKADGAQAPKPFKLIGGVTLSVSDQSESIRASLSESKWSCRFVDVTFS
jgi:hypothetical protein